MFPLKRIAIVSRKHYSKNKEVHLFWVIQFKNKFLFPYITGLASSLT